jgi:CENP-S associating Centromere protein X
MEDITSEKSEAFHPSLTRKLVQVNLATGKDLQSNKRVTNEAVVAAGEVLRLFVQEARHRAGIEAECEQEGAMNDVDDVGDKHASSTIPIRADHITKIAAELLMDFC